MDNYKAYQYHPTPGKAKHVPAPGYTRHDSITLENGEQAYCLSAICRKLNCSYSTIRKLLSKHQPRYYRWIVSNRRYVAESDIERILQVEEIEEDKA
jgi:hypothetical protein